MKDKNKMLMQQGMLQIIGAYVCVYKWAEFVYNYVMSRFIQNAEAYLELSRASTLRLFCENSSKDF